MLDHFLVCPWLFIVRNAPHFLHLWILKVLKMQQACCQTTVLCKLESFSCKLDMNFECLSGGINSFGIFSFEQLLSVIIGQNPSKYSPRPG